MKDQYGREIEYMRVSITDRCNLRCKYCMPDGIEKIQMSQMLTYEEIESVCRQAAKLGIRKLKITGGDPLVRKGCPELIERLKKLDGIEQVTLTTNGILLNFFLQDLLDAGLDAVNISLDTLNPQKYQYITGFDGLSAVEDVITSCIKAGISTKVNTVIQKDFNEEEIIPLAQFAFDKKIKLRFIEMMPIGHAERRNSISNEKVLQKIRTYIPDLEPDGERYGNGPASYYKWPGREGKIGMISAVHGTFCDKCNRIRLTSQGTLKPCLSYETSIDLKTALRPVRNEEILKKRIMEAINTKPLHHCFNGDVSKIEKKSMMQIGG